MTTNAGAGDQIRAQHEPRRPFPAYTIGVRLTGRTEFKTIEEQDSLQFVVTREHGWLDLLAPPTSCLALFIWAFYAAQYVFAAFLVLGFVAIVAYHLNGSVTILSVSSRGLTARGNLNRIFLTEVRIPASEISSLGYSPGGEDDSAGLYAQRVGGETCLLPGLDKQRADSIAKAIRRKFPEIERGDQSPASLLHGNSSGVTTLGLTAK